MLTYRHLKTDGEPIRASLSVVLPTKSDLLGAVAAHNENIFFSIGISYVHPHDRFDKQVGRFLSTKNLQIQTLNLLHVLFRDKKVIYGGLCVVPSNRPNRTTETLYIQFSTVANSDLIRLEHLHFENV